MRNHSFHQLCFSRTASLCGILTLALFIFAPILHAQCSDSDSEQDNSDSLGCSNQLLEEPATPSPDESSPATLTLGERQQDTLKADRSTEASADNSLSNGSSYTENAPREWESLREQREAMREEGRALKPEPPTDFQRFVAASTGQMLPIYGAGLFQRPASFVPIEHAPAPVDLVVAAEDELRIRIWGQVNFSANLRVSREGEIYLPKVGAVHVAGLPFSEVSGQLHTALARVYRNFELSVDLGEIHSIQVYVTGQARMPGQYTVSALSTLVDAVFSSGGPSAAGSMRHVELKRAGKVVTDFDLYALLIQGDKTGDAQLQSGDVLYIPAAGAQVALLGSVRRPGIYELRGEEPLKSLLDDAGGRTAIASGARLSIERIENRSQRRAIEVSADAAGLTIPLADGDIVRIDPIVSTYRETVTLRGSVANPGRFRWHEGMRLSELMPDRDALVSRGYWWRRTQLGLSAPQLADPQSQLTDNVNKPSSANNSINNTKASSGGFNRAIGMQRQTETPAAVQSPSAQTDWNYAVIERLNPSTMTTSLLSFNLGKLVLDHDSSQDLALKPGDVITIFSQDDIHPPVDEQTKYVQLEGEFAHAGVYSVSPSETLRSLVARAGGLTSKAYLYGAEFTRKSTQQIEQQRLSEYADRLDHQLERESITMSSLSEGSSAQAGIAGKGIDSVNHGLIARLRELHPTGRIVLNLQPRDKSLDELPEVPLEDGDRLVVPSMPATIQVIGATNNQSAYLYRNGATVEKYLHVAGGFSREADRGQLFVLRANGSVVGRTAGQSLFSGGFGTLRLYPGDTIVVPEKSIHPGVMRQFMDWTQIFSQLALGAASVNVIK